MNYDRYINQAIAAVPPSGIRRFFDIAATMKDAISLGVGEPDFVTPYQPSATNAYTAVILAFLILVSDRFSFHLTVHSVS